MGTSLGGVNIGVLAEDGVLSVPICRVLGQSAVGKVEKQV